MSKTTLIKSFWDWISPSLFPRWTLIVRHTFSIILMSGDCDGHGKVSMLFFSFPMNGLSWHMHRTVILLKCPAPVWKLLCYHRPQMLIKHFNILPWVNITLNWCQCTDAIITYATPKHSWHIFSRRMAAVQTKAFGSPGFITFPPNINLSVLV